MATECVLLCNFVPPPVQGCKGHGRTHHCRMCSLPMQYGYRTCSLPMQSHCRMCSLPMQYGYRMCSLVWLQNVFSCLRGAVEGRLQNAGGNKDPIDLARIVRVDVYARKKRKKEKEKSFKKKTQIIQEKETNHSRKRKNITKAPSSQMTSTQEKKKKKEKSFKKKTQIIQEKERTSLRLLPLKFLAFWCSFLGVQFFF